MITYTSDKSQIKNLNLEGFFIGWPKHPDTETFSRLLHSSDHIVLAIDDNKLIGFATAMTDKVLSAYIPLLEVLPPYQRKGIGKNLIVKMKALLQDFYMVDICCDDDATSFYQNLDFEKSNGMIMRNYER